MLLSQRVRRDMLEFPEVTRSATGIANDYHANIARNVPIVATPPSIEKRGVANGSCTKAIAWRVVRFAVDHFLSTDVCDVSIVAN
ncbi:hypothetical protein [Paraburkholderia sp. J76]|uniref:hypothetical protein n=1 Tax=Paraburkholderia sp. J76 TaxID=2805439 RepID=UPI002ABE70DF|nr:hypothetical protein [Paraburkholderia sp. J76]